MMKRTVLLAAILAASVVSVGAQATPVSVNSFEAAKGSYQLAGLSWRCGKDNPEIVPQHRFDSGADDLHPFGECRRWHKIDVLRSAI